jgi:pimeloyl-ACP methyl ester carboxylesterase
LLELTPFQVAIPDADLTDLQDRLRRTRWPEAATVKDWSQGVPLDYLQEICAYWADGYDWRRAEAELNRFDHYRAPIDGLDIHFIHARSPHADARPLIITRGWPGSVIEFLRVIGPLTDPAAHGGDADDAFHVVCPSLPGYGFSAKPSEPGWGLTRIAAAWVELMHGLGYDRFFAQGGDWGGLLTSTMGYRHAHVLDGIHLNHAVGNREALLAVPDPTAEEQAQIEAFAIHAAWENGYSQEQATRPQTVGYGLTDSPAGQCAWILEKFRGWTDCDGHPENAISRDRMLDNISLYWLTATAASSARLYWESLKTVFANPARVPVATAYSVFPGEHFRLSERFARTRFADLRYYSVLDRGGHFAAMEQPELFVNEVRSGLRALR